MQATATVPSRAADLAARLDRLRLSRFHWRLLLLSGFGWMFDAIVALIASANTGGLFFGALLSGWLADRIGRKAVFQVTLLVYSLCTGLSALAPTPEALAAGRFLAGLGLG